MPSNDTGTDVSEMRTQVDSVQVLDAEDVSEMQKSFMEYDEEEPQVRELPPERARYRVKVEDYGCVQNDVLAVDYFDRFEDAVEMFEARMDDEEFIRHHDRPNAWVVMEKSYRGLSQVFWEVIRKVVIFDPEK